MDIDGAVDRISCGAGDDVVVYDWVGDGSLGESVDPADVLCDCETVYIDPS